MLMVAQPVAKTHLEITCLQSDSLEVFERNIFNGAENRMQRPVKPVVFPARRKPAEMRVSREHFRCGTKIDRAVEIIGSHKKVYAQLPFKQPKKPASGNDPLTTDHWQLTTGN